MLLDSGAAVSIVMSCHTYSTFTSVYPLLTCAASSADENSLSVSNQGQLGLLSKVLILDIIQHNSISFSQLSDIGINVTFTPSRVTVANGMTSVCGRRKGILYKFSLQDFLCLTMVPVLINIGSQKPDVDDLNLWH